MKRLLSALLVACFALSANAQVLVVKAGADGRVFEPQPLTLVSAILTSPVLTTPALGAATGTSIALGTDPADAGVLRLENAATIAWEADVAGTDLTLTVNSSEQFVFSAAILSPTLVTPVLGAATGTSVTVTGAVRTSSATLPIGYNAGAGFAVTQATNKQTTVVSDTPSGAITMNNESLVNDTETTFQVTCASCAATDVVIVNHASAGTAGKYLVGVSTVAAGSFKITVSNVGTTAGEAIVLQYAVIKAAAN